MVGACSRRSWCGAALVRLRLHSRRTSIERRCTSADRTSSLRRTLAWFSHSVSRFRSSSAANPLPLSVIPPQCSDTNLMQLQDLTGVKTPAKDLKQRTQGTDSDQRRSSVSE
ncbi:hypothetical protein M5K25_008820 [Dendrobium thyrsiflorum]|uniref:Uncharacterized protein n=1 Tax=Dendrobium thyrsiflorum TaxID=117978 RepID=A0ABD0V9I3_DENTH